MKLNYVLRGSAATAILGFFSLSTAWAQTELIVNGGFESGTSSGWSMSGGAGVYSDNGFANSGTYYLWLGGSISEVDAAYQTIMIPGSATVATLSFYYNIYSDETTPGVYDTFSATIRNTSGMVLATVGNWSNLNQDPNPGNPYYHQQTFNLLPYKGQTIRIQFNSSNDSTLVTSFFVDNVSVQVTAGPPINDTCSGAIAMTAGTTYTINTAGATSTGDPAPICQPSFGNGVWYTYTPLASGTINISTCGSDFDTVLAVYTGSCGSLAPVQCNDENGPACAGSQASVSFSAIGGVTYFIMAGGSGGASGNLNILASGTGGLTIIPTFDSSITSDPQAAMIEATINAAIAVYQSDFSNPMTVTITFGKMATGVGHSSTYYTSFAYADYRAALVSHSSTADDAVALAYLPNSGNNPVNGNTDMNLHLPLARALGFSADPPVGEQDATISLNTSAMNVTMRPTDPAKYSLFAAASHEIDEVLGFTSALNNLNNGDPAPSGPIAPEDLFRYDQTGARSFNTDVNAAAYFSLDGITDLARFNQHQGGDFQDWYSYNGGQIPQIQDAYATHGADPVLGVELRALDVIGYARVVSTARPKLSLTRSGSNAVITWPATFTGFALQSATNLAPVVSWAALSSSPQIVNSQYTLTVTNVSTDGTKFYRLTK